MGIVSIYPALAGIPDLLEVVDSNNKALLLMPQEQVLRQHLPHRRAMLIVCDRQGRIVLCRLHGQEQSWGFALCPVPAGASYEDTACGVLASWGLPPLPLHSHGLWPPCATNSYAFTACYRANLHCPLPLAASSPLAESMLLDMDELRGIASSLPQQLAPEVHWALTQKGLFSLPHERR
ncbi:MAG: NUDIX hydrolase [Desulfovibrionaceae bacterium]|nr:NUDIX hydrolase [Desulfovibrionaceae bacterium]